ncbi:MAG TPA: hypothetical protein VME21_10965 [Steroidobacteraceae bacterium]|nr:hypothetical protein [Steroidobacteraceae bacterium]
MSDKTPIALLCPSCRVPHQFDGFTPRELWQLLTEGAPIDGLCLASGESFHASADDRTSIARALGMAVWK